MEKGTIQHVPSTQSLLLSQGLNTEALQRRAAVLAASLTAKQEDYEEASSPRSDASTTPAFYADTSARNSLEI